MNPLFTLLIKQLPRLLPLVKTLLDRSVRGDLPEAGRLRAVEQSVEWLAERSDTVEKKLRRLTVLLAAALLLSVVTLVIALAR
jgi:hypothetical protein